ncbi:MAG: hypothetical protein WBV36_03335, partial [Terriglobales bacterium]
MKINLRLRHWAVVASIAIGWVGQASASGPIEAQSDAVDAYLQAEMAKQRIPGLALLVSRGGQVIRSQS